MIVVDQLLDDLDGVMSAARKPQRFLHLTRLKSIKGIVKSGLRADGEGAIYVFVNPVVADTIAAQQVFTRNYAVFEIDSQGITGVVGPDDVAELSAPWHRRIVQPEGIHPRHLRLVGRYRVPLDRPFAFDFMRNWRLFGMTADQTWDEFRLLKRLRRNTTTSNRRHEGI